MMRPGETSDYRSGLAPIETPGEPSLGPYSNGPESHPEFRTPYPGHSLFQDSFFVCSVKGVVDTDGLGKIYLQVAVDPNCGLAFAKIYTAASPMNAVDLLESKVLPFYRGHGVPVERVVTPASPEFAGRPLAHAFETLLAVSHIDHLHMGLGAQAHDPSCERFYRVLVEQFFAPALRKAYHRSVFRLEQELDAFVEAYNRLPEGKSRLDAFDQGARELSSSSAGPCVSDNSRDRG